LAAPTAEVEAVAGFGAAKVIDAKGFEAAEFAGGTSVVDANGLLGLGKAEGVAAFCFQVLQCKREEGE
jgi:hypothetical protein